ncbi:hypothetical protein SISNIDRAFT_517687 [Sistotremastrum niveocremeum HHB9708]|uniref:F-box domain-containing protein n=1 Tax=Sistotremastrum niveocremeum HHB9708 TaxID=1314777 RepID=A0A164S0J4_9AGAM|nr:hypothetical protein SISNIDRAFT_517687 [Sistotremastrum niveocremeum HHB9708]
MVKFKPALMDVPEEIFEMIISALTLDPLPPSTILDLLLISHRWKRFLEPHLYNTVLLQTDLQILSFCTNVTPHNKSLVKRLTIQPPEGSSFHDPELKSEPLTGLNECTNLQSLAFREWGLNIDWEDLRPRHLILPYYDNLRLDEDLPKWKNVTHLRLDYDLFFPPNAEHLECPHWEKLKQLTLEVHDCQIYDDGLAYRIAEEFKATSERGVVVIVWMWPAMGNEEDRESRPLGRGQCEIPNLYYAVEWQTTRTYPVRWWEEEEHLVEVIQKAPPEWFTVEGV